MSKAVWVEHGSRRRDGRRVTINTVDDLARLLEGGEDQITIFTFAEFLNAHLKTQGKDPVEWEVIVS